MVKKFLLGLWLTACVGFFALLWLADSKEPEAWWVMIYLTFPSGLLLTLALGGVTHFFYVAYDLQFLTLLSSFLGPLSDFLLWLLFVGVGYLQWFWLLPRLIRRVGGLLTSR